MMAEILVSLFGAISTIFASYFAYAAHRQGKVSATAINEINNAVNKKPKNKPRLYDMIWSNYQRVDKLERNVEQISLDVNKLTTAVREQADDINHLEHKLENE